MKAGSARTSCIALLRGINVGGKNLLPMSALSKLFAAAGCSDVRTYIQSGNVLFHAEPSLLDGLAETISAQIAREFGLKVPVILRTAPELAQIVGGNPFLKTGAAEEILHVMFLAHEPKAERIASLDAKRSSPDEFVVLGREVFLKLPNGVARSKLTNSYLDSKLETTGTSRNWRTVLKLLELCRK